MKRILLLMLSFCVLVFCFSACDEGTSEETTTPAQTESNEKEYTLVINADDFDDTFSEGEFYEEMDAISGLTHSKNEATNEYTLKMTESAYNELKKKKAAPVYKTFDELINDEGNYVVDIKYDEDFRNITIVADTETVPANNDSVVLGVAISAMAYQFYTVEGQQVKVTIVNSQDESVLNEIVYPIVFE